MTDPWFQELPAVDGVGSASYSPQVRVRRPAFFFDAPGEVLTGLDLTSVLIGHVEQLAVGSVPAWVFSSFNARSLLGHWTMSALEPAQRMTLTFKGRAPAFTIYFGERSELLDYLRKHR